MRRRPSSASSGGAPSGNNKACLLSVIGALAVCVMHTMIFPALAATRQQQPVQQLRERQQQQPRVMEERRDADAEQQRIAEKAAEQRPPSAPPLQWRQGEMLTAEEDVFIGWISTSEMAGDNFACTESLNLGIPGAPPACQIGCLNLTCGNAVELCHSIPECGSAILNQERTFATLKRRPQWTQLPFANDNSLSTSLLLADIWNLDECRQLYHKMALALTPGGSSPIAVDHSAPLSALNCEHYMSGNLIDTYAATASVIGAEYGWPPFVVDIGMHNGHDSQFYIQRGLQVIAVEADDEFHRDTQANPTLMLGAVADRFTPLFVAVSPQKTPGSADPVSSNITFFKRPEKREWNSITDTSCEGNCYKVVVPAMTCAEVVRKASSRVWYMKIDIEGADADCLRSLDGLTQSERPKYISTEYQTAVPLLASLGYTGFKLVIHSMNNLDGGYGGLPDEVIGRTAAGWRDEATGIVELVPAAGWRDKAAVAADAAYAGKNNDYHWKKEDGSSSQMAQLDLFACMDCPLA